MIFSLGKEDLTVNANFGYGMGGKVPTLKERWTEGPWF